MIKLDGKRFEIDEEVEIQLLNLLLIHFFRDNISAEWCSEEFSEYGKRIPAHYEPVDPGLYVSIETDNDSLLVSYTKQGISWDIWLKRFKGNEFLYDIDMEEL